MKQMNFNYSLTPLTYIHIGSGDYLDPITYVIRGHYAYYLNETEYIRYLTKRYRAEFKAVMDQNDAKMIKAFFHAKFDPECKELWLSRYKVDPAPAQEYLNTIDSPMNQSLVAAFIRSGLNLPFLPGSSIKGAIRTALASDLVQNKPMERNDAKFQASLFKYQTTNQYGSKRINILSDPFKYLKLSDMNIHHTDLTLKKAVVVSRPLVPSKMQYRIGSDGLPIPLPGFKKPKSKESISEFMEVLDPAASGGYVGSLSVVNPGGANEQFQALFPKQLGISPIEHVITMVNKYYLTNLSKEEQFFKTIGAADIHKQLTSLILNNNECIIRIGRGSGQRFCTYEKMDFNPKTRRLIDNTPMGWCKLKFDI
jgi:CRISPR-associated protein Csm5